MDQSGPSGLSNYVFIKSRSNPSAKPTIANMPIFRHFRESRFFTFDEINNQPAQVMIGFLEEMVHREGMDKFLRKIIENPYNISRILKLDKSYRPQEKLAKYFHWLNNIEGDFVYHVVRNFQKHLYALPDEAQRDARHPIGVTFMSKLGALFVKFEWSYEAYILLGHAISRAKSLNLLLPIMQSFLRLSMCSTKRLAVLEFAGAVEKVLQRYQPPLDFYLSLANTLAMVHYQKERFVESYNMSLMAFDRIQSGECRLETVVNILRQLSLSCLVTNKLPEAWLLIMQALNRAPQHLSLYAACMDDLAHHLLMVREYKQAINIHNYILGIYKKLYGPTGLPPALLRRELAFSLFLENLGLQRKEWPPHTAEDRRLAEIRMETMYAVKYLLGFNATYHGVKDQRIVSISGLRKYLALKKM